METTNLSQSNEAATLMMEGFKKQLNLISGFYTNIFNSFSGKNENSWSPLQNNANLFFNNEALKSMFTPFNGFGMQGNFSNPFASLFSNPFDKINRQFTDYNKNLMSAFTNQSEIKNSDFGALNEKYKNTIEKELEASKNVISSIVESYNKQMEFSLEATKKLQEEINKQINIVFKLHQQFWSEALNAPQLSVALEKFSKDGVATDNKKQTKATATT
jgi:hypothetical protein